MLRWNDRLVAKSARAESKLEYPTPTETRGLAERTKYHGFRLETAKNGVNFVFEPQTGRRYFVTLVSCQCRQFIGSGSAGCQHLALLQVERGSIPEAVLEPVAVVELEAVR